MNFTAPTGCSQNFSHLSPLQIFQLFFCEAVWQLLVRETNRYANQTLSAESANSQCTWIPTNVPEMKAFVALLLSMGINKRPSYAMYWSRCEVLRSPLYPSTMSRNRFMAILRFLHLADNTADDSPRDKLSKVRPLLDIVVPLFRSIYKPGQNLSPDETMIKFNGRLSFKQYIPRKSAKYGLKCFSLNESQTGYTCDWKVFTGFKAPSDQTISHSVAYAEANHPPNLTASGQVVIDLLKGLENKGHVVFMDNWYTSPALVHKLSQLGFGARGTVRYTTQGIPDSANPKKVPMNRHDPPQFFSKAGQLCVVWQDTKKRVAVLTNYGNCKSDTKDVPCKKSATGRRAIQRPAVVNDYNKYMGGSDLASQMCQYYTHPHRSLKWWKRVFFALLDICLVNATIVHNSIPTKRPLSSLDFRVQVIDELLSACRTSNSTPHAPETALLSSGHYPGRNRQGQKRNCVVCSTRTKRKQTRMICKKCQKPMCLMPCFETFHNVH